MFFPFILLIGVFFYEKMEGGSEYVPLLLGVFLSGGRGYVPLLLWVFLSGGREYVPLLLGVFLSGGGVNLSLG